MASPVLTDSDIAQFDAKAKASPTTLTDSDIAKFDSQGSQQSQGQGMYDTLPSGSHSPLGIAEIPGGLARGVVQGGQEMLNTGANVNELLGSPLGKGPRKLVDESRAALDLLIPPSQSISGKIAEGLGNVPGLATTYAFAPEGAVIPEAAILGAINAPDHNTESMIKGAAGNALLMGLLGKAQKAAGKSALQGAGMGALVSGGAAAFAGQDNKDIIAQAALGGGFSLYPQDSVDRLQKDYKMVKTFMADPKANAKAAFNLLKEDPVQRNMRIISEKESQLREQTMGVNFQAADMQKQRIEAARNLTHEDQKAIEGLKTAEQKRTDAERIRVRGEQQATISQWQQKEDDFTKNMPSTAESKAKYIQNNYKKFFGQATEQYGPQMDKVASTIGAIAPSDAFGILGSALDKSINDYKSSDTQFAKKILKLQDKYNPEKSGGVPGEIQTVLDRMSPDQKTGFYKANPSMAPNTTPVKFKNFYTDVRHLLDSMDPSEHNAAILRREVGNYIAKVDPSFQELQSEYSHIVSYREELASVFHPYDGEAALKNGEKWLTQFGMGRESNLTNTERRWLSFMEQGFQGNKINMKGIGSDVSDTFSKLGDKIDYIKREIEASKDTNPIYSKYGSEIANITQEHVRNMADLESKQQLSKEALRSQMESIKNEIDQTKQKALFDIELKKKIYEKGRRRTNKLDESRKRIEGLASAFGMGMAGANLWKASRLFRAGLIARKAMRLQGRMR